MSNGHVNIKFSWGLTKSDPDESPVLFVGLTNHLNALEWDHVKKKLEPRVNEETWRRGLQCVGGAAGEAVELRARGAALASLGGARGSRHAAPSRAHVLARVLRQARPLHYIVVIIGVDGLVTDEIFGVRIDNNEAIQLVCRKRDLYANAAAIARSFPLYSARSSPGGAFPGERPEPQAPANKTVVVEIILVEYNPSDGEEKDIPADSVLAGGALGEEELACVSALADCTRLAARLTDTPANIMHVDQFIQEAFQVAKELDLPEPTVIRGSELRARGMGGLHGVGAAAERAPALLCLSHRAPGAAHSVAWVGKGIVYDTGGLSLKARTSMVGMKGDCGGAAAVLAAFAAFVRARPTVNVHAVLCLAENAVGPKATRPDDIHTLYSGRTVEINNTDAEGRLVLSDGVVYASRDLKANIIVDVATLTGAQGTATGKYHAAILSNSSNLESQCVKAGYMSGDLTHPLPFAPELHFVEFTSTVADMKNSVADRNNAQPSCAGLFVLAHLGFEFPGAWLHVDMAAPAHTGERATGYGVALLTVLFGHHTENKLLQALSPGPIAAVSG